MKELKRFQVVRRIEWQEAAKQKNKSFYKDPFMAEAATANRMPQADMRAEGPRFMRERPRIQLRIAGRSA